MISFVLGSFACGLCLGPLGGGSFYSGCLQEESGLLRISGCFSPTTKSTLFNNPSLSGQILEWEKLSKYNLAPQSLDPFNLPDGYGSTKKQDRPQGLVSLQFCQFPLIFSLMSMHPFWSAKINAGNDSSSIFLCLRIFTWVLSPICFGPWSVFSMSRLAEAYRQESGGWFNVRRSRPWLSPLTAPLTLER